jgi:putative ABC transport system permease protein
MFKSVIKHSFRSFRKQKGYFIINLLGLALGLACSLLISTFVIHELSFDKFNKKSDRIYKLILNGKIGGQELNVTSTAAVIAPTMKRDFPEIEKFLRINTRGSVNLKIEDQNFDGNSVLEADSTFFQVFSIPLVHGNADDILNKPYRLVLSESTAQALFGNENPIDREILLGTDTEPYIVSGIMTDIPENCHFEADLITSFMTNPRSREGVWLNNSFETYLLLIPGADPVKLEEKFPKLISDNVGIELEQFMGVTIEEFLSAGNKYNFFLQPLLKIHHDPAIDQPMKPATDPKYLIIFGSVALIIILIASINFTNLSTAQASRRTKEVGMKKVSGSSKGPLVTQFLSESVLLSMMALVIAVVIVKLSLPLFNNLLNSSFQFSLFANWYTILLLILATLVVGLIAGSYPAFYLSSISPNAIFKGTGTGRPANGRLRSILVIFQFAASIILITGTSIMYRQITFMLNKDLGYKKENLLVISRAGTLDSRVDAFKERVKELPGVVNIAAATAIPNRNNNNNGYMLEGRPDESLLMATAWVDYDHLDTYQMEMITGRFFSTEYPGDVEACILNEAAIKEYNISNPLSARIARPADDGNFQYIPVVGVVKDFNHESLQRRIQPYIMMFRTDDFQFGYLTVRLAEDYSQETVSSIGGVWNKFTGMDSMPHFFMEDDFDSIYSEEKQSATLTIIFAVFALFVASMGLFGLTSFMLQQRTKEIGIRKAMGASVTSIFNLITKDILILVAISAIIGSPLIYLIAKKWLEGYYFRIEPGIAEFVLGFLVALIIALATISIRTLNAAKATPANSLRYQ